MCLYGAFGRLNNILGGLIGINLERLTAAFVLTPVEKPCPTNFLTQISNDESCLEFMRKIFFLS